MHESLGQNASLPIEVLVEYFLHSEHIRFALPALPEVQPIRRLLLEPLQATLAQLQHVLILLGLHILVVVEDLLELLCSWLSRPSQDRGEPREKKKEEQDAEWR